MRSNPSPSLSPHCSSSSPSPKNTRVLQHCFFLYRLLCVSSQMSASVRSIVRRPLGNLVTGQSSTIWIIVCCGALQSQEIGSVICCQRVRLAAHRPWPVLKRFSVHHRRRGKSNPGTSIDGSATSEPLSVSANNHSSSHWEGVEIFFRPLLLPYWTSWCQIR